MAKRYVDALVKRHDVAGVVLLGGYARGSVDEHSDIDLAIFVDDEHSRVPVGERWWHSYDVDHMVFHLNSWRQASWSQEQRQAFSEGRVLYDPQRRIERLLNEKVVFPDDERKLIIVTRIMYLAFYGITYRKKSTWRGYKLSLPPDLWLRRGCAPCAHLTLPHCLNLLIELLFAYNRKFIPDLKWRLYRAYDLPWLPKDFRQRINEILVTRGLTANDFRRRLSLLNSLYDQTIDEIASDGVLPRNVYRFYLREGKDYATKPT